MNGAKSSAEKNMPNVLRYKVTKYEAVGNRDYKLTGLPQFF